ncbi:type VI secretion system (T6SS) VasB/ImpH family protein [Chitinophaga niastensis]|uniref:Type VI secretion system (T6SS) VasB/ImpH family protein n=1 Tax=Chitinophaga niastensis TaxID=536980 RepID=A0A2P8HK86_CHINA|nr:hypothetical protein [Chitinophaga niastensis]PSL46624.1 type VI secretion system (T6SS) VasB/ImpH family protein [Chitinophaga niastensis]
MVNNAQKAAVLEEVIEHINALPYDVRAEVVVGELLDNHVREDEVVAQMRNVFTRSFTTDIINVKLDDSQPYQPFISMSLSRDGIYDRLPQGLFHEFSQEQQSRQSGVGGMVARYKKQQQQQQQARKFFQPLENEFFLQRVFLERREKHLLFDVFGKDADQLFHEFWELPRGLPAAAANRLVKLLPYAHRIAGNMSLVKLCLELVLEEDVDIVWNREPQVVRSNNSVPLGECLLGVDAMVGELFYTDMPRVTVTIGPLQRQRIYDYLPWQPYGRLLETCYGYFFPADVEINTELEPSPKEKKVAISDRQPEQGIMGYNFFL